MHFRGFEEVSVEGVYFSWKMALVSDLLKRLGHWTSCSVIHQKYVTSDRWFEVMSCYFIFS